jgi:hypothetical protein
MAQPGDEITVAVRAMNGDRMARPLRYRLRILDAEGQVTVVQGEEVAVHLPIGDRDERILTLRVPRDVPPGAYYLALDTGLRRRIGTVMEPFRMIAPIAVEQA